MIRALWPLLAIMIACSACFTDTPAMPSASAPPGNGTPSPSPRPTPIPLTKAQAAKRYLRIVRPYDLALNRFETAAHANRPWAALRPLAGRIVTANTAQIRALRTTPWPANSRKYVQELIVVSTRAGRYWRAVAKATTPDRFRTAVLHAAKLSGKSEATRLRRSLGLAPYRKP